MSRRRAAALAALLVVLVAYGAVARRLPGLPSGLDVAFHAVVVFPAFAAAIWLALPLARVAARCRSSCSRSRPARSRVALSLLGVDSAANVAKLACYALAGFWFLTLFEELWWIALVAVLVPWVDIWSVAAGPTEYVVEEQPGIFERVSIAFPTPGRDGDREPRPAGHPLLLALPRRRRPLPAPVAATWIGMSALPRRDARRSSGPGTASPASPRCPPICLGFLLPNADLLWRDVRRARAELYRARLSSGDGLDVRRVREHVDGPAALELVAVLVAEHLEIRGERRRVARDVDDPRRAERARSPERLPGEPGARRIDHDDVRAPRLLAELLDRLADVPGEEPRVRRCR